MAKDNHANLGRVGFTVFIGAIAIAIALIYIAGIGDKANEFLIETYYDYPVSGLSVGSAVNFRGVKIGEVREISFASAIYDEDEITPEDYQRIIIVMALDCRKLDVDSTENMRRISRRYGVAGLRATIASNAVTGMSRIEFNIPDDPVPPAKLAWKPRYYQIPPQPSLMENLSSSLANALHQFNKTDFKSVWSNISAVAESSAQVTKEVSDFIRTEKVGMSIIVRNIQEASDSVDELAETLKNNPSLLLRKNDPEPLSETK